MMDEGIIKNEPGRKRKKKVVKKITVSGACVWALSRSISQKAQEGCDTKRHNSKPKQLDQFVFFCFLLMGALGFRLVFAQRTGE
jgi:hypothetical protein